MAKILSTGEILLSGGVVLTNSASVSPPTPPELSILSTLSYPSSNTNGTGVALAELDNTQPGLELLVGSGRTVSESPHVEAGAVANFDIDGNTLWTYESPTDTAGVMDVSAGDIDGDGDIEIAVGFQVSADQGVALLDHTGNQIWQFATSSYARVARIVKVRNDYPNKQMLIGGYYNQTYGFLKLLDEDGNLIWEVFPAILPGGYSSTIQSARVSDMDGDGQTEIYLTQDRHVMKFNYLGEAIWRTRITESAPGFANRSYGLDIGTIGGVTKIAAVNETSGLSILDTNGNILDQIATPYRAQAVVIGDGDNDGDNEFIVEYSEDPWTSLSNSGIIIFDENGGTVAQIELPASGPFLAVGDVNNDGDNEIVVPCSDGTVYILGWQ